MSSFSFACRDRLAALVRLAGLGLVLLLGAGAVLPLHAWDAFGHELVAHIAWQQLSPEVRKQAAALLTSAPRDADLASLRPADGRHGIADRRLFELASTWPDVVRDREFPERNAKYHRGNWHYVNWYWRQAAPGAEGLDVSELPTGETHIVERIVALTRTIADDSVDSAQRGIALAWVLHLVGDLHQPLHTGSRVTDLESEGDRGGNLFRLSEATSLHWYWDQLATNSLRRRWFESRSRWVARSAERLSRHEIDDEGLLPRDVAAWARESHARVLTIVYSADVERDRMPSPSYRRRSWATMEPIVTLAGVRLAALLEEALAP